MWPKQKSGENEKKSIWCGKNKKLLNRSGHN